MTKRRWSSIGLIGNLKTHEMERKTREEKASQKKKTFAFKSTPTISDDEDDDQDDDEDLSLLMKNVRRIYNKTKFNNQRRWLGKEVKKIVCYNCRKPGHVIADCPDTKSKLSISKKSYKMKALKATWDSKSDSEEEVDMANVYFMANENTPKVTSESYLDDCELSMDELGETFEELFNNYDFLKKKYFENEKEK